MVKKGPFSVISPRAFYATLYGMIKAFPIYLNIRFIGGMCAFRQYIFKDSDYTSLIVGSRFPAPVTSGSVGDVNCAL